jgi:glyoxylase-like metal-dependent hydrolase (beta-lactamase superfamily II)
MRAEVLVQQLKQSNHTPTHIYLTHGHVDHIGGVEALRMNWPNIQVAIHKDDAEMLGDPMQNLSVMAGGMVQALPAEVVLDSQTTRYEAAGQAELVFIMRRRMF